MAVFVASELSKFTMIIAGTTTDISAYITDISGLPGKRDLSDVTTFGSVGHRWKNSLQNAEFTVNVLYSEDSTYGTNTTFGTLRASATTSSFIFYPAGTTGQAISGNFMIDDYTITSKVGDAVKAAIHGKVDNGISIT